VVAAGALSACRVVHPATADCLLATEDGLCRIFDSMDAAAAAAREELGPTGWTLQPVTVS